MGFSITARLTFLSVMPNVLCLNRDYVKAKVIQVTWKLDEKQRQNNAIIIIDYEINTEESEHLRPHMRVVLLTLF